MVLIDGSVVQNDGSEVRIDEALKVTLQCMLHGSGLQIDGRDGLNDGSEV